MCVVELIDQADKVCDLLDDRLQMTIDRHHVHPRADRSSEQAEQALRVNLDAHALESSLELLPELGLSRELRIYLEFLIATGECRVSPPTS